MAENTPSVDLSSSDMPKDVWSMDERLFIQLYFELLLTAATMPAAPYVYRDAQTHYSEYHQYFTNNPEQLDQSSDNEENQNPKGLDAFNSKRDKLVGAILWSIRTHSKEAAIKKSPTSIVKVTITPQMLEDYRTVRDQIGINTYVHDPTLWPELSEFLQAAIQEEFPSLSSAIEVTAESNSTSQAINPEDDGDAAPQVVTGQLADSATTPTRGTASPEPTNIHDTDNNTPALPDTDNRSRSRIRQTKDKATEGNKRSRSEAGEEDEGLSGEPPKKQAKKQDKKKIQYDDAELGIIVQTLNTQIAKHGFINWIQNFSSHAQEATTAVNNRHATDRTSDPVERTFESTRRKIAHTSTYKGFKKRVNTLVEGQEIARDELMPQNAFTVQDFDPNARAEKSGKGKKS
jgi:hypothetical protein